MHLVIELFAPLRQTGARLAPYVLLELLLPGGTLFALLLFLHRRARDGAGGNAIWPVSPPALVSAAYGAVREARSARGLAAVQSSAKS